MSRQYAKPMPAGSVLLLLLFLAVLLSAIGVSYSAHWNRQLLNSLYAELSVRDKAQGALHGACHRLPARAQGGF